MKSQDVPKGGVNWTHLVELTIAIRLAIIKR
jgi:hypothetical protein